jgi:hypothetical protein
MMNKDSGQEDSIREDLAHDEAKREKGSWQDAPRSTVQVVTVEAVLGQAGPRSVLRGIPSWDGSRANLFCVWEPGEEEDDPLWGPSGIYQEATQYDEAHLEIEVRFAFATMEDVEDHAEVYVWQAYHWELVDGQAVCTRDEYCGGEYVVESGGFDGPEAIFHPVVSVAIERITSVRSQRGIS